ncbi:uncharacterized protein DSM5745_02990 [Aspergillus mulundensis]|uniref:Uncharacterized protein n=1 Tax=Aspergillus mulundensis TaxID=1810919 RepID=A0A3D8SKN7_9EURO|nr:hypothetical protein DSM5745_02990 [Aspergillus mulundensis]RDW86348.1 hypothetical protein DSM5745_02990 [Aspergillus mulundensis]
MPKTWNSEAERKLLVGILAQVDRVDYPTLAAHMGDGFSVAALRQQICKLRREAGIPANSVGRARVQAQGGTPRKSKQSACKDTPIERAKRPYCFIDDDNDEDKDLHKDVKPIIKEEDDKTPKIEPFVVELVD